MRAVVFDLDDTLIIEEQAARDALAQALRAGGADDDVDAFLSGARRHWHASPFYETCCRLGIASWEGLWATFEGCHPCLDGLAEWAPTYRAAVWEEAAGSGAAIAQQTYIDIQRAGHPSIPPAIEAVRVAKASMPIGMLTNGPPDIQRRKLANAGLDSSFDAVVISGELGVGKPSPEVFTAVLDRLGVAAADAVMVGNSWERDVEGALAVGMAAIWVGYGERPPADDPRVTVVDELTVDALTRV